MASEKLTDRRVASLKAGPTGRLEVWDEDMRGLFLRVSGKSKVWGYRYRRPDNSQPRVRLGHYVTPEQSGGDPSALTVAGARMKARKLRSLVDDGGDPATDKKIAKAESKAQPIKTVRDLADAYFAACESGEHRPRRKQKRAKTIEGERYTFKKYVGELADVRVEALSRHAVKELLSKLSRAGLGVTSNRVRALLRGMYAYGVTEGRVETNPVASIEPLAEEKPRQRVLTDDELAKLWAALVDPSGLTKKPGTRGSDRVYVSRPIRIIIQLAALTLQRRGEVAGMRETDLDLDAGVWTIPAEMTKAGRLTKVPLTPNAIALIREAMALRSGKSAFVFPTRSLDEPVSAHAISHAMRRIRDGLGIDDITCHDLRRSGASRLAEDGVSPFIISKLLNHAGDSAGAAAITMSVYVRHTYDAEKRQAMEALDRLVMGVVSRR